MAQSIVYPVSLGCPKNLVDIEVLTGELLSAGYGLTFDPEEADVQLINTCAFIPAAREEAYRAIRDAAKWKKQSPGRCIVVAGCLTEYGKHADCRGRFPAVDLWLGVDDIPHLVERLNSMSGSGNSGKPEYLYDELSPRLQLTLPHLAYLKIADGCDNHCSYCAIPGLRGDLRSRTAASVLAEAKNLLAGGVRELVLIAQDVTVFGADRPQDGETLTTLLKTLDELEGDFVVRLLYTHPAHYTAEFIDFMSESRRILPYLDIPLQHANDRILAAMNRHVDKAATERLLGQLRSRIPGLVLRTTFITGFPGETGAEFNELCDFVEKWRFERCGVFPYAPEKATPAAKFPGQVPRKIQEERAAKLMKIQQKIMLDYQKSRIGTVVRVIVDSVSGRTAFGRGVMDAPEIDNLAVIKNARGLQAGDFCDILIENVKNGDLVGSPLGAQDTP